MQTKKITQLTTRPMAAVITPLTTALMMAAVLSGCATPPAPTEAKLTYQSSPAGAKIYLGDTLLGTAPLTQTFPADGKTTLDTPVVTAVWVSGAKTKFWTQLKPGDDRETVLERPAGAPNLKLDLDEADRITAENKSQADRLKDEELRNQKRTSAQCLNALATGNNTAAQAACY